MNILIDDQDVTTEVLAEISERPTTGVVFPSADTWLDLLPAIENNDYLKKHFFEPGIHTIKIVNTGDSSTSAKIFIKSKYSTRNR